MIVFEHGAAQCFAISPMQSIPFDSSVWFCAPIVKHYNLEIELLSRFCVFIFFYIESLSFASSLIDERIDAVKRRRQVHRHPMYGRVLAYYHL